MNVEVEVGVHDIRSRFSPRNELKLEKVFTFFSNLFISILTPFFSYLTLKISPISNLELPASHINEINFLIGNNEVNLIEIVGD